MSTIENKTTSVTTHFKKLTTGIAGCKNEGKRKKGKLLHRINNQLYILCQAS